uniref:Uncharacterized protein n=1 Tax=Rhizophora mucronata TaxID=61149 RepID=A0A2P2P0I2_RHIMU
MISSCSEIVLTSHLGADRPSSKATQILESEIKEQKAPYECTEVE